MLNPSWGRLSCLWRVLSNLPNCKCPWQFTLLWVYKYKSKFAKVKSFIFFFLNILILFTWELRTERLVFGMCDDALFILLNRKICVFPQTEFINQGTNSARGIRLMEMTMYHHQLPFHMQIRWVSSFMLLWRMQFCIKVYYKYIVYTVCCI